MTRIRQTYPDPSSNLSMPDSSTNSTSLGANLMEPAAFILAANVPDQPRPTSGRMVLSNNGFMWGEGIVDESGTIKGVAPGRAD